MGNLTSSHSVTHTLRAQGSHPDACVEQRCPFFSTTYMNKSNHAALWKSLTITRYDPERDCVPCFLDQVDDVWVWLVCDGAAVHGQYSVPHLQLPTAVRRAALNDASYFVRHGHTCISSFCVNIHVCLCVYCMCEKWCVVMIDGWFVVLIFVLLKWIERKQEERDEQKG